MTAQPQNFKLIRSSERREGRRHCSISRGEKPSLLEKFTKGGIIIKIGKMRCKRTRLRVLLRPGHEPAGSRHKGEGACKKIAPERD